MSHNEVYWSQKEKNSKRAKEWYKICAEKYESFIKKSRRESKIYNEPIVIPDEIERGYLHTDISYMNTDTVSAIIEVWNRDKKHEKIAALNFASYKNPGGRFLDGSTAQEECLCRESILCNVLESFRDSFYKPNLKRLNGGLYDDNLIYSPNILFVRDNSQVIADVITCAAPNYYPIKKYNRGSYDDVIKAMISRIDHILYATWKEGAEVLILGAFGCGVFMNDPVIVSQIFHFFVETKYMGRFKDVVFAVPTLSHPNSSKIDSTYTIFKESGEEVISYLRSRDGDSEKEPKIMKYLR